ncbi:carbamate kinase [Sporomusa acidovorans]|uniref:Carbamate kinase n=1 Tax=Sporomusa acidovorans (strain ATCC 49682 / DSM 3132 / Mol) TaxID=1123286 RepID=A0ABZ3J511_SPOA4|nr:carbamate kinase [Sporomusa acidovorans]OZC15546.1 carbamate kinase 1 [Sporomusa acidovorans DSM 3132]SDE17737.1 carbamate kinase [Sporomusa acidovorans]
MRVVVALGGNALQAEGASPTAEAQLQVVKQTAVHLADMVEKGYEVIIVHGNGPQVGRLVIQNEYCSKITPAMPFDVCGAMSQGMIGYHIQQALRDELTKRGINKPVASVITQVVVNKNDQGFKKPTKPIGPFYNEEEAKKLIKEKGYAMVEDSGRGFRRVVASPQPERIVEINTIRTLIEKGNIVITAGGGGVPVVEKEDRSLEGVAAVIDKDFAAGKLADELDADVLMILTAVDKVAVNFGKPDQRNLSSMTMAEAKRYIAEGQFAPGSMLPKVKAALKFQESKIGRKSIIASLDKALEALQGKSGTVFVG